MNELEKSNSAYLLHHSKNPIYWKPWTTSTLNQAKSENKLIILSIGYSAYWFDENIKWTNIIINKFWGEDKNLFAFTESEVLYKKSFEIEDQVIP